MPHYMRMGEVPPKRHTQFRKDDGSLYKEEVFGTEGFDGVESILYHHHAPTRFKEVKGRKDVAPKLWDVGEYRHHHLRCGKVDSSGDPIEARRVVAVSDNCNLIVSTPTETTDAFFRNGGADELWFVREGSGVLETVFGLLPYRQGDYIHIPRGTTYRFRDPVGDAFFMMESPGPIGFPDKYRNADGQFVEHSPYCERDIHGPSELITIDEEGTFTIHLKMDDEVTTFTTEAHPFDVVGWDGYNYPFTFNISDFEPITGRIHQPPPVHATFEGPGFEVISWVPRKVDYHPDSIPAPYYHSNIDTDEMIFYVEGEFASREGIDVASMTIHRKGLHHGPQPGRYEGSIGVDYVDETAVMIETEGGFTLTKHAKGVDDPDYMKSWQA